MKKKNRLLICVFLFGPISIYAETGELVRLVEFAANYDNTSKQGPETIGSILSSVRLANSLTANSLEVFNEQNKTGGSGFAPRIKYSHQFTEDFFIGLNYTQGADVFYDRTSIGSQGAYLKDKTKTKQNEWGIRLGAGPLDYLADDSYEFSIGYSQNTQKGPYLSTGLRIPKYDSSLGQFTNPDWLMGNGTIEFHNRSYSLNYGVSSTGDIFGAYISFDFQVVSGSLKLASNTMDYSSKSSGSISVGNSPQLTFIHFTKLQGFMFGSELGLIIKFTDSIGLRAGGYYQLAFIDYGTPSGLYYANGKLNEVGISTEITSAETRSQMGFWGFTFGIITKL
ncbi:MAG: hypothetical protein H3C43_05855 [Leptonema sp. (in: Bacteria)]|nr:hypothetical protein [Leptonema sp. (in: bacteria)]